MDDRAAHLRTLSRDEILLRLLHKEQAYYDVLLDLSRQENDLLERSACLADVLKLTRKRRIILTCIEEIDQALKPLKRQWLSAQDRSPNVAQLWNNLSCTLKQILDIDQRNQVLMRVQMHDQGRRQMPKHQTACDSG